MAVAAYLQSTHPDVNGFSPRNVRRMREFYRMYENAPDIMREAMEIGWTQNVVILEAELTLSERKWYIRAVKRFGWSKLILAERIAEHIHEAEPLDRNPEVCYTVSENRNLKDSSNHSACCEANVGQVWQQLFKVVCLQIGKQGLRALRPPDRYGYGKPAEYVPHLRRRSRKENSSADGLRRASRHGGGRPLVHPRLRGDVARCRRRLLRTAGGIDAIKIMPFFR